MGNVQNQSVYRSLVAQILIAVMCCASMVSLASAQKMEKGISGKPTLDKEGSEITPEATCSDTKFALSGNSGVTGQYGNIRLFGSAGVNVKISAFSRRASDGLWETAFVGAFAPGLGITNREEDGNNNTHHADNVGDRKDYFLLEFNQPIALDDAWLRSIVSDSDITVWLGNSIDPYNNHLTLSDALLADFQTETNNGSGTSDRWADVNAGDFSGNVAVIAASTTGTQNDWFKLGGLGIKCPTNPPAKVTIIKQAIGLGGTTASTTPFTFTSTKFGAPAFQLVDNDVVGPDRISNTAIYSFGAANAITVTEDLIPAWTLSDLACTETGGTANTTVNFAARTANIIVEPGESVTCTYTNVQLRPSAAHVTISGRALTADYRGVSSAILTLWDLETGEQRVVITNQFGYYAINDVEVGKPYLLSISHKRYSFADSTRSINLVDQLADMNFIQTY